MHFSDRFHVAKQYRLLVIQWRLSICFSGWPDHWQIDNVGGIESINGKMRRRPGIEDITIGSKVRAKVECLTDRGTVRHFTVSQQCEDYLSP